MANQSYLNLDDEENDSTPYSSVSNRDPLQDITNSNPADSGDGGSAAVKDFIKNKLAAQAGVPPVSADNSDPNVNLPEGDDMGATMPAIPSAVPPGAKIDPMMAQFNKDQADLDSYRQAKMGSDSINNFGQAFSQLARGASAPVDNSKFYQNLDKQGQQILASKETDSNRRRMVMDAIENRNSRVDIMKQRGQDRADMMKMQGQARSDRASDVASAKQEQQNTKWAMQLKDDLDPNKARGGNLALNQKRVDNADRVQALLTQVHNNPDPRQMEELAISTQALLSASGTPGAEQVKALIPKTAVGDVNKFKEWLLNDPTGTGQQAFVQRMADTVNREKGVASGQVQHAQRQRLSAYSKFKDADPDQYNSIVGAYGLGDDQKPKGSDPDMSKVKSAPNAGDIEDGHRFKGGNPADPNAWEQM